MSAEVQRGGALLITTALEETWGAPGGARIGAVFLAPWCRRYSRRAVWEPLGARVVPDPWASPEALAAGIDRVRSTTERALAGLGTALGAVHQERWSEREARILLGPWLLSYVPAQLDRWERLSLAVAGYPAIAAWGWPEGNAAAPVDTLEAVQLLKCDRYNLQLMTPMMHLLGIQIMPAIGLSVGAAPAPPGHSVARSAGRRLAERASRAMFTLRGGRAVAMRSPAFSRQAQIELVGVSRLRAMPAPSAPPLAAAAHDSARRAGFEAIDLGDGAFERHLASALLTDLPVCFLEGYGGLRSSARAIGRCPRAVLSATAWHYEEAFKRWAADGAAAGSLLLGVQHGGNYGIDAYAPSEDHETAITDRFYTWGWTREGVHAQMVPMPASKLVGRPEQPTNPAATGILLATTSVASYPMQLNFGPERLERYLAWQGAFLAATSPDVAGVLRVRLHIESPYWDIAERIGASHPGMEIEPWSVPFVESLATCRLFVCDHLSTTFAEALAAKRPTVLFWDPADTPVRADAAVVFDELRAAGILFDDPVQAAVAVGEAYGDIVRWWNAPARVAAVEHYRARYARTGADAIDLWAAELRGVVDAEYDEADSRRMHARQK